METISQVSVLEQLSVPVTAMVMGTILLFGGQSCFRLGVTLVTIGFVWSVTVTVVVQGSLRLPAASVATSVMVCVPNPNAVVWDGVCETATGAALLSLVRAAERRSTVAVQFVPAATVLGAGQVMVGGVLSAPMRKASSMLSEKMALVPTATPL